MELVIITRGHESVTSNVVHIREQVRVDGWRCPADRTVCGQGWPAYSTLLPALSGAVSCEDWRRGVKL